MLSVGCGRAHAATADGHLACQRAWAFEHRTSYRYRAFRDLAGRRYPIDAGAATAEA
jgi:hypothetical protein